MYLLGQQAQGGAAEKEAARTFFLEAVGDQEDRNMLTGDGLEVRKQFLGIRQSG